MLSAFRGAVEDVQEWKNLPAPTFLSKCDYVVNQEGRGELMLLIVTIILALGIVVWLCARKPRRSPQTILLAAPNAAAAPQGLQSFLRAAADSGASVMTFLPGSVV